MPDLHDYQLVAVDHLRNHDKGALFLDMGLGKTASALSALEPRHLPALVVAPKRVAENVWEAEQQIWRPDLSIGVAAGTRANRQKVLQSKKDLIVIGRDNLRDALPYAARFKTLILDEMSSFKTRSSVRWKAAKKLDRPYTWGLTGTPAPNGLLDLWAQLYLLDRGERLGTTLTGFRSRYFVAGRQLPNGVVIDWRLRPGAEKRIHHLLEDICLSMSGEGRLKLAPVTFNSVVTPLPAAVRQMYRDMKENLVLQSDLLGPEVFTAANAAVLSNRLSQIAAGFVYPDNMLASNDWRGYTVLHREKVRAVQAIIEGTGSPVLVYYGYKAEADMLRKALPPGTVFGPDTPELQKRWNAGDIPVLLSHPASIGHGLNLQYGGHTIAWMTKTWNLEEWLQGNKRLARQGQQHPVVIHTLDAPRTVDNVKTLVLEGKTNVQDALLEHLESPL